jgi:flavin-dependent dehydrogenase
MQDIDWEVDVAILGGGLAGLSLARQLQLAGVERLLLLERAGELPPRRQKAEESTGQLAAYYFARVLGLEEHLLTEHFLKYNLRFYWKAPGGDAGSFEGYSQSFLRQLSNLPTYQLDRNWFEGELLRQVRREPGFELRLGVSGIEVQLRDPGPHLLRFREGERELAAHARWVVDASGRSRLLARQLGIARPSPVRHDATFAWLEGVVDLETLSDLTPAARRVRPERSRLGHTPPWLATNHFMGDGFWLWTLPLNGMTSVGAVYDPQALAEELTTPDELIDWAVREFPLFARDLKQRQVVDHGVLRNASHDCGQTLSGTGWALSGEAGRFPDPLYSLGSDLIAIYNTLIVDAVLTTEPAVLARKVELFERLMRAVHEAYMPSFVIGYGTLGDQECFSLRYTWELAAYFAFYVFPFINDLFTEVHFLPGCLARFSWLGSMNHRLQTYLQDYARWKKQHPRRPTAPILYDFAAAGALGVAERTFYRVGVTPAEAEQVLAEQVLNLEELARAIVAHAGSEVVGDRAMRHNAAFVSGIDLSDLRFDPQEIGRRAAGAASGGRHGWSFHVDVFAVLAGEVRSATLPGAVAIERPPPPHPPAPRGSRR